MEQAGLQELRFHWRDKLPPYHFTTSLASAMAHYPDRDLLLAMYHVPQVSGWMGDLVGWVAGMAGCSIEKEGTLLLVLCSTDGTEERKQAEKQASKQTREQGSCCVAFHRSMFHIACCAEHVQLVDRMSWQPFEVQRTSGSAHRTKPADELTADMSFHRCVLYDVKEICHNPCTMT
jgi:hypothetical protein